MARCPACGVDAAVALRAGAEVTVGTVAATIERRPVVTCPDDHGMSPTEVVGAAMEAAERGLPRARSRVFRGDACRSCGAALTMPMRRTVRSVTIDAPGLPVLTMRFDLPSTRCPECGTDQVPSRSQEDLVVAVPALFAER
jgi:hypothetical protein